MMVKCPKCKKEAEYSKANPHRPFCSLRCRDLDLGAWASGDYVVDENDKDQPDLEKKTES